MLTGSLASGSLSYHNNVSLIQITAGSLRYGPLACQRATKTHIFYTQLITFASLNQQCSQCF